MADVPTKCPHCGGQVKNGVCRTCGYRVVGGKAYPPATKPAPAKKAPPPPKKKGG